MSGAASWRTPIALQLIFAIVVIFVVWGLPESPRWYARSICSIGFTTNATARLAKHGREAEAEEVLCAVFDLPRHDPYIVEEMAAIRAAVALEQREGTKGYSALFKPDLLQTRRRVLLAWFMQFMNQLSG